MTEPAFREIQLSTKQLVFLFMSAVVVLVVVFLLGVSVGRGVGADPALQADTSNPGDTLVPAGPPATSDPGEAPPPLPPAETTEADVETADDPAPVTSPPPAPPPPDPDPPAAEVPPPPVTQNPPVAGGDWAVQLGAFGSVQNADALVLTLTQRGYAAYREQTSSARTPYAVRVGPFTSRAQAEITKQRLAKEPEGYDSLIIR